MKKPSDAQKRHDPILRLEIQRAGGDCTVAALASITGKSYEDILVHAAHEDSFPHEKGLFFKNLIRIGTRIGYPLRIKRECDFHNDKGILCVRFRAHEHVVILMGGLIFDPADLTVWLPSEYKKANRIRFGSILVPA